LLYTFHLQRFSFIIHTVDCERNNSYFYQYLHLASAATVQRISAVCRLRQNETVLPDNFIDRYWTSKILPTKFFSVNRSIDSPENQLSDSSKL
jgi:hypothetical protein